MPKITSIQACGKELGVANVIFVHGFTRTRIRLGILNLLPLAL